MECHGSVPSGQDIPHVQSRHDVDAPHVSDRVGMVETRTERDQCTAIVADHREPVEAEVRGDCHDVRGHRPLGVGRGVELVWLVAGAVATKIRTDDGVMGGEVGCDVTPHQMRLRESVQQYDRRTRSPDGDGDLHAVGDHHTRILEPGQHNRHVLLLCSRSRCAHSGCRTRWWWVSMSIR